MLVQIRMPMVDGGMHGWTDGWMWMSWSEVKDQSHSVHDGWRRLGVAIEHSAWLAHHLTLPVPTLLPSHPHSAYITPHILTPPHPHTLMSTNSETSSHPHSLTVSHAPFTHHAAATAHIQQ